MKKHKTLLTLGGLICSQILPIVGHADIDKQSSPSSELQSTTSVIDNSITDSASEDNYIVNSTLSVTEFDWNGITVTLDGSTLFVSGGGSVTDPIAFQYLENLDSGSIKEIVIADSLSLNGSCNELFMGLSRLESIKGLENIDTSSVTDMSEMFQGCNRLIDLNLSSWNVDSVTNMQSMFTFCYSLSNINTSSWNTSSVENMANIFSSCDSLEYLNLSHWNTSSVNNMDNMFFASTELKKIELGKQFRFIGNDVGLSKIYPDQFYTGYWEKVDSHDFNFLTSEELTNEYNPEHDYGTYIWQKYTVISKYVDEVGVVIDTPISLTGELNTQYKTEQKIIPGYRFKEVIGDTEGIFADTVKVVTYIYILKKMSSNNLQMFIVCIIRFQKNIYIQRI